MRATCDSLRLAGRSSGPEGALRKPQAPSSCLPSSCPSLAPFGSSRTRRSRAYSAGIGSAPAESRRLRYPGAPLASRASRQSPARKPKAQRAIDFPTVRYRKLPQGTKSDHFPRQAPDKLNAALRNIERETMWPCVFRTAARGQIALSISDASSCSPLRSAVVATAAEAAGPQ